VTHIELIYRQLNFMWAVEDRIIAADPRAGRIFEDVLIGACSVELTRERWEHVVGLAKDTAEAWIQEQRGIVANAEEKKATRAQTPAKTSP
jgi:hypothetical protein